ncbi:nucleolin-like isoform X4 [Felis catus]|uniref:nucleolin-like isoform X4 n=1 Tax=Felis catus TaxID=9685 RepID=UPI001D19DF0E|nr:nucleolin-like isoform X4 [Felis catus]
MSFFPKEIEYGEDEMSDDGSRDEAVIPQKNGGKVTTAPENKVGGETSPAPVVAEKLTSPHRKTATWAKLPKDRRSGNDEEEEDKNTELGQDEKEPIKKTPDKWKKEMAKQKASPEIKKQRLEARNTKTLLIKDLPDKVTQRELKEVFKDAFQIRLVSKDGMNKRIAYADFKSQADAKRALEDKQGTKIGGLAVALDPVGEKSQGQEERGWKNSTRRTKDTDTMMKASLSMKLTQNSGERKKKKNWYRTTPLSCRIKPALKCYETGHPEPCGAESQ